MKSTVSEKGRVTIPKRVRAALGLRAGTVVEFSAKGGRLVGTKVESEDVFRKWRGRGSLPRGQSVDEYLNLVRDRGDNGR